MVSVAERIGYEAEVSVRGARFYSVDNPRHRACIFTASVLPVPSAQDQRPRQTFSTYRKTDAGAYVWDNRCHLMNGLCLRPTPAIRILARHQYRRRPLKSSYIQLFILFTVYESKKSRAVCSGGSSGGSSFWQSRKADNVLGMLRKSIHIKFQINLVHRGVPGTFCDDVRCIPAPE
jgi:hypothetical protein